MDADDWHDDGFGGQMQGGTADPLVGTEYARMQQRYTDAGYREGIGEGKLSTLQAGFDGGFAASVPPARRVGQLRGRANALLAIALSPTSSFSGDAEIVANIRALVADLAAVKRDDVLPVDHERAAHEAEHHADDEDAFELERNDQRDMEGLEDTLGNLGKQDEGQSLREEELLLELERRVNEAEEIVLRV